MGLMDSLSEMVKPRLAQIATNAATKENDEGNFMSDVAEAAEKAEEAAQDQLDEMSDFFLSKGKLSNGTQILLSFSDAGMQIATGAASSPVFGKDAELELGSIELSEAVLDVWLGDDPLVP